MANLTHVELITPERPLFSGEAEAVVMRTDGGDITFLANHMDYIAAVDICVVRLQGVQKAAFKHDGVAQRQTTGEAPSGDATPQSEVRAAVHGGFVMVAHNTVTIVSGVAELAQEIDVPRAERALQAAEAAGGNPQAGDEVAPAVARPPSAEASAGTDVPDRAALDRAAARARARLEAAARLESNLAHM
jgi:F-type H+-transporting ATPase subunit epsilon